MLVPIPEFYACSFYLYRNERLYRMDFNMPTEVGLMLDDCEYPAWAAVINFIEGNFKRAEAHLE